MLGCQAQKRRGNDALPTTICWQCIHFLLDPRAGSSSTIHGNPIMGRKKNRQKKNAGSCWKVLQLSSSLLAMLESGLSTNALCSWVLKVWPGFKAKVQPALFFLETIHLNSVNLLVIMKRPGLQPGGPVRHIGTWKLARSFKGSCHFMPWELSREANPPCWSLYLCHFLAS